MRVLKFKNHEYEKICVYCKHYLWEINDRKAYCMKHECCINHGDTCDDWVDDGRTMKDRPRGYRNSKYFPYSAGMVRIK